MAGNKKRKKSRKKHCNSKREVFQMVQDHINEKATRENMRKQGKTVLVPDAEKFFPEAGGQQEWHRYFK